MTTARFYRHEFTYRDDTFVPADAPSLLTLAELIRDAQTLGLKLWHQREPHGGEVVTISYAGAMLIYRPLVPVYDLVACTYGDYRGEPPVLNVNV